MCDRRREAGRWAAPGSTGDRKALQPCPGEAKLKRAEPRLGIVIVGQAWLNQCGAPGRVRLAIRIGNDRELRDLVQCTPDPGAAALAACDCDKRDQLDGGPSAQIVVSMDLPTMRPQIE